MTKISLLILQKLNLKIGRLVRHGDVRVRGFLDVSTLERRPGDIQNETNFHPLTKKISIQKYFLLTDLWGQH